MPKRKKGEDQLVFPPGVKDITEDISTDDLIRRLKDCASAFQSLSQEDEDNSVYIPLAFHLATECYLEHNSRDVQILTACCIADVFRVYAPEPPYKDALLLKTILEFFVEQLKGLEDSKAVGFKRHFYLLENLAWVKTFNVCIELEENQTIICNLFNVFMDVFNDGHSVKVKAFMLDIMSPLISEADTVSPELLDVILKQLVEPRRSKHPNAYSLAQEVLRRTSSTIEPYIQAFFNSALILGKVSETMSPQLYDVIYELNSICPHLLDSVIPQLEFKLKSSSEDERMQVTEVLAKILSSRESKLITENKMLWKSFIGRFNDISATVRSSVVKNSMAFIVNHPELSDDIQEQLQLRTHDQNENIRYEVVRAVIGAAKEDLNSVSALMLNCVKERTLDKKFKIRKEALLGLATLYKQHLGNAEMLENEGKLSWIPEKVLHAYYLTSLEDKLLVERILHTCLVPYQFSIEDRMGCLYKLVTTADDHAFKALKELLRCQNMLRNQLRIVMEAIQHDQSDNRWANITTRARRLTKNLQDPIRAEEQIMKFCHDLESNLKIRNMLLLILNGNISCSEIECHVKGILKSLGLPVQTNHYYMTIKQLLERVAPIMIDRDGIKLLVKFVKDSLIGSDLADNESVSAAQRCLGLLQLLSVLFPKSFQQEDIYSNLLLFLQCDDDTSLDLTLQILINSCSDLERKFPDICSKLIPLLENLAETGSVKQAKHAVYCLHGIVTDKESIFGALIERLKEHFTLESQYFRTALVSVGHIAFLCHDLFPTQFKSIVTKTVVKDLLMLDKELPRGGYNEWGPLETLPEETKVKIAGMKLMVHWLVGLKSTVPPAISTFRLLSTIIVHKGDLMDRQHTAPQENAWLRLTAATCTMKLCQENNYLEILTCEQFQVLASLLNDDCIDVRRHFAMKLHKGLMSMKLPLQFMAIFALSGTEENTELKDQVKTYIVHNVAKRREYLKQNPSLNSKEHLHHPDNVIPYVIHLLAHAHLKQHDDLPSLLKIKQCLSFIIEPTIAKNESEGLSFLKSVLESIKKTTDKQDSSEESNFKLYAVSDLAFTILINKGITFATNCLAVPTLPKKLYSDIDESLDNTRVFLPPELIRVPVPSKEKKTAEVVQSDREETTGVTMSDEAEINADDDEEREMTIETVISEDIDTPDKAPEATESNTRPRRKPSRPLARNRKSPEVGVDVPSQNKNSADISNSERASKRRHVAPPTASVDDDKEDEEDISNDTVTSNKTATFEKSSEITESNTRPKRKASRLSTRTKKVLEIEAVVQLSENSSGSLSNSDGTRYRKRRGELTSPPPVNDEDEEITIDSVTSDKSSEVSVTSARPKQNPRGRPATRSKKSEVQAVLQSSENSSDCLSNSERTQSKRKRSVETPSPVTVPNLRNGSVSSKDGYSRTRTRKPKS